MTQPLQTAGFANLTGAWVASATPPKYIQYGTGTGAAQSANALVTPASNEVRTSGTLSQQQTTLANDTYQVLGTVTCATAGKTITEVGVFDAAGSGGPPPTGGNMDIYGNFSGIALNVGDSIAFTIKVAFS